MEIRNVKNLADAQQVLIDEGFEILSPWEEQGIFCKNGEKYQFEFPIWTPENKIRIKKLLEGE